MKWFYKWLRNKLSDSEMNVSIGEKYTLSQPIERSRLDSNGMNFTVYRANGGYIIEHKIYDYKTDRNINSLHIITNDQELGEEIAKIITYENLRS